MPDPSELLARLEVDADPVRAAKEKAYLKSDLRFLGAGRPAIRALAKEVAPRVPDAELLPLVRALWGDVHELRALATTLLERRRKALTPDALPLLEQMLRTAKTWAYVDDIAAHVVGSIAERYDIGDTLDRWATDEDFWLRRSAMLALLVPLRNGKGDPDRFFRYAETMLEEREFFVRKAIGWILRDISRKRPKLVADWVRPRAKRMAGLTFREATRRLPDDLRAELTAAREG